MCRTVQLIAGPCRCRGHAAIAARRRRPRQRRLQAGTSARTASAQQLWLLDLRSGRYRPRSAVTAAISEHDADLLLVVVGPPTKVLSRKDAYQSFALIEDVNHHGDEEQHVEGR